MCHVSVDLPSRRMRIKMQQWGHLFGGLVNPKLYKNSCSSVEKIKTFLQSIQEILLGWNCIISDLAGLESLLSIVIPVHLPLPWFLRHPVKTVRITVMLRALSPNYSTLKLDLHCFKILRI